MQEDGNFVLYPPNSTTGARWAANGGNKPWDTSFRLRLLNDGTLEIIQGPNDTRVQRLHLDVYNTDRVVYYPTCSWGSYIANDFVVDTHGVDAVRNAQLKGKYLCDNPADSSIWANNGPR